MQNDFLLEKYKYILDQKKELNKATFIVVAIFQALVTAVFVGTFCIVQSVKEPTIPSSIAVILLTWMSYAFAALGIFCILMICGGIISWFGYRRNESILELEVFGIAREAPRLRQLLGWYETYIIIAIAVTECGYFYATFWHIIPYISQAR